MSIRFVNWWCMSIKLVRVTYRLLLTSYHPNTAKIMMKVNDSALKKGHTPCSGSIYFVVQLQEERLPAGQYTSNVHSVFSVCYSTMLSTPENIWCTGWMNEWMNEWVLSIGGMIMTGQNWSTQKKTCRSTTLSTTNSTRTGLGLNPGLRRDRLATDHMRHGTALHSVKFWEHGNNTKLIMSICENVKLMWNYSCNEQGRR